MRALDFDHISPLLIAIITTLFSGGGFLVFLINRKDTNQKERQEATLQESKKNQELLEGIQNKLDSMDQKIDNVETEVQDHTQTIAEIKEDQDEIMNKVGLLEEKSKESLKATLLSRFDKFSNRGWVTAEEKNKWNTDYKIYSAQGGNGEVAGIEPAFQAIPVRNRTKKFFRR